MQQQQQCHQSSSWPVTCLAVENWLQVKRCQPSIGTSSIQHIFLVVSEARKILIGSLTFEPVDERQEELPLQPFHSISISASQPCCLMNTNTSPQLMNNKQVPLPTSQHAHEISFTATPSDRVCTGQHKTLNDESLQHLEPVDEGQEELPLQPISVQRIRRPVAGGHQQHQPTAEEQRAVHLSPLPANA
jgi:hypothetical protein